MSHVPYPGCYCADCVEGWPGGQAAEVLADFRAAFANRDESAWLIERRVSPPQWSVEERPTGVGAFFSDVHRAYRFQTRDAAERAMRQMCITPEERAEYFVSEHMWITTPSARITGDKDRENSVEGAPLEATNRRVAIECHRLRAALRWIADTGYVDEQSGNQNFEHLQSIARDALAQPKDQPHD